VPPLQEGGGDAGVEIKKEEVENAKKASITVLPPKTQVLTQGSPIASWTKLWDRLLKTEQAR
jgi:hypothetical protein